MKKSLFFILLFLQFSFANAQHHTGVHNGYEWVDLGLPSGTLWATCNIGATNPEENGDYFAWGETEPKIVFTWDRYLTDLGASILDIPDCGTYKDPLKDFVYPNNKSIAGTIYDAALTQWGEGWAMPSLEQAEELFNKEFTKSEFIKLNGVDGRKFISLINGNSIFIPEGHVWTSNPSTGGAWFAYCLTATSFWDYFFYEDMAYRYDGLNIRPVITKERRGFLNGHEWVDLGLTSGTLWATCNIGANFPESYGEFFAWGEDEEKKEYTEESYIYNSYHEQSYNDDGTVKKGYYEYLDMGNNICNSDFDVARNKWGKGWQMPTFEQLEELIRECDWQRDMSDLGYIISSKIKGNNNSIFLPFSGYISGKTLIGEKQSGAYWSSSSCDESSRAKGVLLDRNNYEEWVYYIEKYNGCNIRPVIVSGTGVEFEDPKFEKYCIDHFDTNGDGRIQIEEAEAVEKIKCDNLGIVSLSGIENFKNLVVLECYDNNINELYLNNNTLLEGLDCGNNEIYVLDVSGCNRLEHLDCNKNCISELDLATNTNLRYLNCSINRLSKLNLSNNGNLQELRCAYNKLNILDISDNEKLDKLVCHDNPIDFLYMLSTQVLSEFDIPGITTVFYKDTGETGIEKIGDTDTYVSSVYTIDGKPSSLTNKGLNIIRSKDGKPKKVIIK